jgi:DNA-binding NtrC family response regulator
MFDDKSWELRARSRLLSLLSFTTNEPEHMVLAEVARRIDPAWQFLRAAAFSGALRALRRHRVVAVVCDADRRPDSWKEMVKQILVLPDPPHLIVSSRLADELLWAEALSLGAYDVLSKPFDTEEVSRVLSGTWHRWRAKNERPPIRRSFLAGC